MVDLCPVVKWAGILIVVWKLDRKSLFMVYIVQYSNGLPSHVTLPLEYRAPILSGIQVFCIQMITVDIRLNFFQCVSLGPEKSIFDNIINLFK